MDDNDPLIYGGRGRAGGLLSRLKITHICWAVTFVILIILMSLLSYQVHLTRRIAATTKTIDNNTGGNQENEYTESITSAMDFSANPCNDFYQYSCGSLIANTQLPAGVNMYIPIFNDVQLGNYLTLNNIVNDQWPLINDLYTSCMVDSDTLTQDTVQSLTEVVNLIQGMNATSAPVFLSTLATLHRMGVDAFFQPSPQENIFQANSLMNLMFAEDTLSLNLSVPSTVTGLTTLIQSAVGSIFTTYTKTNATNAANIEATLFQNLYEDVPENITDIYVNMTWPAFATLTGADYSPYTNQIGLDMNSTSTVIVVTPDYMKGITSFFDSDLQSVKDYLVWRVIYSFTFNYPILPEDDSLLDTHTRELKAEMRRALNQKPSFVDAEMLRPHLSYATQFTSQQISCIDAVDTLLGDFVGLIFSMQTIDDDVINDIHTVTGGIQNSFKNNLAGLSWIDASSKANADFKLSNILQIIGHPNRLDRYRGLLLDNENFLENIISINQRVFDYEMTNINTPYNRSDSEFPATIVNAFYNPEANTINFPAGILESPMFSTSFPALMQYARMGYVIGHETTHGFDNNGRLWNAYGVYEPIMDDASSEEFNQRAQCIVDQYNQFQPVPNVYVNGEQTLGENIADIGGVKNAFLAYQAWVKANGTANMQLKEKSFVSQLTNEQAFFVVLAQTWCTKATQKGLIQQVQTDVHSPSQYRVNGPLANLQEFADAFNCPKNSPMNPTNKCELW